MLAHVYVLKKSTCVKCGMNTNTCLKSICIGVGRYHINHLLSIPALTGEICFISKSLSITDALPRSCQRLQELDSLLPDDYYWVTMVAPKDETPIGSAIIYCHDMASATPREFLPLPAGSIYNYASMSKIQSSKGGQCYSDRIFRNHGYTGFNMVRITLANISQASTHFRKQKTLR